MYFKRNIWLNDDANVTPHYRDQTGNIIIDRNAQHATEGLRRSTRQKQNTYGTIYKDFEK